MYSHLADPSFVPVLVVTFVSWLQKGINNLALHIQDIYCIWWSLSLCELCYKFISTLCV